MFDCIIYALFGPERRGESRHRLPVAPGTDRLAGWYVKFEIDRFKPELSPISLQRKIYQSITPTSAFCLDLSYNGTFTIVRPLLHAHHLQIGKVVERASMGTRGFIVYRFRGRYYAFYNHWDSYPEGLGLKLVEGIPEHPGEFQNFIQESYDEMSAKETKVKTYLCRARGGYIGIDEEEAIYGPDLPDDSDSQLHLGGDECCSQQLSGSSRSEETGWLPSKAQSDVPSFLPPLNDLFIEYIYTFDYEHDAFSVNNSAHFRMSRIPQKNWIPALLGGIKNSELVLDPKIAPADSIASLAAQTPSASALSAESLDLRITPAGGIEGFGPLRRQGLALRNIIFRGFSTYLVPMLSAALLSWNVTDFAFREIAYAILCLASGDHTSLIPCGELLEMNRYGFSDRLRFDANLNRKADEFLAHLATGAHLRGYGAGSAPKTTSYWFNGALVRLVAHLDQEDDVQASISAVREQCLAEKPDCASYALLISIEHIILLRVYPHGNRVDRSEALTLFEIDSHHSLAAQERYSNEELSMLRSDFWRDRCPLLVDPDSLTLDPSTSIKDGSDDEQSSPVVSNTKTMATAPVTFSCLGWFLEVSACSELGPVRATEGVFSVEIYRLILHAITNVRTYHACMRVSRIFRDLCHERCVLADGIYLLPGSEKQMNPLVERIEIQVRTNVSTTTRTAEVSSFHNPVLLGKFQMQWDAKAAMRLQIHDEPLDEDDEADHDRESGAALYSTTPTIRTMKAIPAGAGLMQVSIGGYLSDTDDTILQKWKVALGNTPHQRILLDMIFGISPALEAGGQKRKYVECSN